MVGDGGVMVVGGSSLLQKIPQLANGEESGTVRSIDSFVPCKGELRRRV